MAEHFHPTEVIARFLLLTPRRVRQLTAEGVFTRARDPNTGEFLRGRYSLIETTQAYIKFLRDGKLDDPDESNLIRARTRRALAAAESEELRLAAYKGELHRADDIEFIFTNIFTAVKARLFSIPSRITRLLIGKTDFQTIFDIIMREIEAACSELVEINASMFSAQNEQYLAAHLPVPVAQHKSANGDGADDDPQFDTD